MSVQLRAFRPLGLTQNVAVGAAATTQTFVPTMGTFSVRFCNIGNQTVFILPGESNQTAATLTNAIPIPAGQTEIFTMSPGTQSFSAIAGSVGSTLYYTVGEGM